MSALTFVTIFGFIALYAVIGGFLADIAHKHFGWAKADAKLIVGLGWIGVYPISIIVMFVVYIYRLLTGTVDGNDYY